MKGMNRVVTVMAFSMFVFTSGYSLMQAKVQGGGDKPGECSPPVTGTDGKPMCMLTSGCNLLNGSCKYKDNACVCEAYPIGINKPVTMDEIRRALQ